MHVSELHNKLGRIQTISGCVAFIYKHKLTTKKIPIHPHYMYLQWKRFDNLVSALYYITIVGKNYNFKIINDKDGGYLSFEVLSEYKKNG